jgi:hypothetical protein
MPNVLALVGLALRAMIDQGMAGWSTVVAIDLLILTLTCLLPQQRGLLDDDSLKLSQAVRTS